MKTKTFPAYMQAFFTERLSNQLQASPHTVASYRDTFRLLLKYASSQLGRNPTELKVSDISPELVAAFLGHTETVRGNCARSRNTRLSAIRSFFRYLSCEEPALLSQCERILTMPAKKYVQREIDYLRPNEIEVLLKSPDQSTWLGRRDFALLSLMIQTGLRVSELVALNCNNVQLGTGANVRCLGKGRKERSTPLGKDCAQTLADWIDEQNGSPSDPLFRSQRKTRLSRDTIGYLIRRYSSSHPELSNRHVTPHVLRHTTAMQLLQGGVDQTVIALWLGHSSVETTQIYIHANLQLKEQVLSKVESPHVETKKFEPGDQLLEFLESL